MFFTSKVILILILLLFCYLQVRALHEEDAGPCQHHAPCRCCDFWSTTHGPCRVCPVSLAVPRGPFEGARGSWIVSEVCDVLGCVSVQLAHHP